MHALVQPLLSHALPTCMQKHGQEEGSPCKLSHSAHTCLYEYTDLPLSAHPHPHPHPHTHPHPYTHAHMHARMHAHTHTHILQESPELDDLGWSNPYLKPCTATLVDKCGLSAKSFLVGPGCMVMAVMLPRPMWKRAAAVFLLCSQVLSQLCPACPQPLGSSHARESWDLAGLSYSLCASSNPQA